MNHHYLSQSEADFEAEMRRPFCRRPLDSLDPTLVKKFAKWQEVHFSLLQLMIHFLLSVT